MRNRLLHLLCILSGLSCLARPAQANLEAYYNAATDIPLSVNGYTASGDGVTVKLFFAPETGTELTVVENTGLEFIDGTFDNLAQGDLVTLDYDGVIYQFVANYYGGTGNDLVLVWAGTQVYAWGNNEDDQLGRGSQIYGDYRPHPVVHTGVLANKTVVAVACGGTHSLALCSDGTVAAWGANSHGQLGDNSTTDHNEPVQVSRASGISALFKKTVVAISAGYDFNLALCSDGTVVSWGYNGGGQLGDNTLINRSVPVKVNTASGISALFGKTPVMISAGGTHSVVLCADGTLVSWGNNDYAQLGDDTIVNRPAPVLVNTTNGSSVLFGKSIVAISAGWTGSLALCSDNTLAGWGTDLPGDNTSARRNSPVAVNTDSGVSALFGKTITAISAGGSHGMALCSDGTIAAWGSNGFGWLGDNSTINRYAPVAVNTTQLVSTLYGKTPVAISAGWTHSLAVCSDGTLAAWGGDYYGQLGNSVSISNPTVPSAPDLSSLLSGQRVIRNVTGSSASHNLALVAEVPREISVFKGAQINNGERQSNDGPISYPASQLGVGLAQTFTIQNTGPGLLADLQIVIEGTDPADFFASPLSTTTLAAGEFTTFTVTFSPLVVGARTAEIHILSNDVDEYPFVIQVTGSGTNNPIVASYTTGDEIPVDADSLTATGNVINFSLNYAPPTGKELIVAQISGSGFIQGTFTGLAQGQTVTLSYAGSSYDFVANYYGGTGNDLVLVWKNSHLVAWGFNSDGQLGDGTIIQSNLPTRVNATGILSGKTVVSVATGNTHTLILCSDGTLAAMGDNDSGQLGDNTLVDRAEPVAVNTASGVSALFGKTVIAIAAGSLHSMALCSDGTLVAWGHNGFGQMGLGGVGGQIKAAVEVSRTPGSSALAGKSVTAISAGDLHSLALCSDGTVAAWGGNHNGQLGDSTTVTMPQPVAVSTASGVSSLFGKTVVAICAGGSHSLALCSDGTVSAWGLNNTGQLGNNATISQSAPVGVLTSGASALSGKLVTAISAGSFHCLALCSDGTLAAWGNNSYGQLGDNTGLDRPTPVLVKRNSGISALFGKTVSSIHAAHIHSLATCSDGTVAGWGANYFGTLGDGTDTNRLVPTSINTSTLAFGETVVRALASTSAQHSLALVATGSFEIAVFDGSNPGGTERQSGVGSVDFGSAALGTSTATQTFNIQNVGLTGALASLRVVSTGDTADFTLTQPASTVLNPGASSTFTVTFLATGVGARSASIQIQSSDADENPFVIQVSGTGTGGTFDATYNTGSEIPITIPGLLATGNSLNFTLNYIPTPGTELTVVKNTGAAFIQGTFSGLSHGQIVTLNFNGNAYPFMANYYGGSGNDLVLAWPGTRVFAWGKNENGQLGDNSSTQRNLPVAADASGVLAGKTVFSVAAGSAHSLALCSDGTLAAWGDNSYGQLGNENGGYEAAPILVDLSGLLAGQSIVAITAGGSHSMALRSDGAVIAWGYNSSGQLGDNSTVGRGTPALVNTANGVSALYGKTVTAIAAGAGHSLALCSDGTVAAWGYNSLGELGDTTTTSRTVPVTVAMNTQTSALFGKTVVAIAAGSSHSMALCSDGTVACWGWNASGQLGNNTNVNQLLPVAVDTSFTLSGKFVTAIAAGANHSLALCSDGSIAAWGEGEYGQLGTSVGYDSYGPAPVLTSAPASALAGKIPTSISAGFYFSLAGCSDGTSTGWGYGSLGQLGDNTAMGNYNPVATSLTNFALNERIVRVITGPTASHALALVAPPIYFPEIAMFNGASTSPADERQSGVGVVTYPNTASGGTNAKTFTIQNAGGQPLTGLALSVTGADDADFTATGLGATTLSLGSTTTFTVTFAPQSPGDKTASIQITSNDGNESSFSISVAGSTDTTSPTLSSVTIASNNADPARAKVGDTITLDFTASEAIQPPTVTLLGAAATSIVNSGGNHWTATATVSESSAEGVVPFTIAFNDLHSNVGTTVTSTTDASSVTVDYTRPTVTINLEVGQAYPALTSPIYFTVVFSEPVTDFAASDVTLSGAAGATATVTGSGTTYQVAVSGLTGDGSFTASLLAGVASDSAGNLNLASLSSFASYDFTVPTLTSVTIASSNANPALAKVGDVITLSILPSETIPTPTITLGGSVATINKIGSTGWTGTITVGAGTLEGATSISVNFNDNSGNVGTTVTATTNASSVTVDRTAPTVTINQAAAQADPTDASPIDFTVVFSESVTNFTTGDVTLSGTAGATTGTVSGSGTTYQVSVSGMTGSGTVIASLLSGVASDAAGNLSLAGTSTDATVTHDGTAPTLSPVTIASNNANPVFAKEGDVITLSFDSSETIQTPTVTLAGSVATVANGGGNSWTATLTVGAGTTEGVAAISVDFSDTIGNAGTTLTATTNASSVTVDRTAPTVTINQSVAPSDLIAETTNPNGTMVSFDVSALDDLSTPTTEATPPSGSLFPIGETTVHVVAKDGAENETTTDFTVTVRLATISRSYNGLATPTVASTAPGDQTGAIALTLTKTGAFTGKLRLGGTTKPIALKGTISNDGVTHFAPASATNLTIERPDKTTLHLSLTLDPVLSPEPGKLTGILYESAPSTPVATIIADRALFTSKTPAVTPLKNVPVTLLDPATDKGKYTVLLQAKDPADLGLDSDEFPQGDGWAQLTVLKTGVVKAVGKLADGSPFSCTQPLSQDHEWPLYVALYKGKGSISGFVHFRETIDTSDADGLDLLWFKPPNPSDKTYRNGWPDGITTDFLASKYVVPASDSGDSALLVNGEVLPSITKNATLTLEDGLLTASVANDASISTTSKVAILQPVGLENLKCSINAKTGVITGSFKHPLSLKTTPYKGVIFQKQEYGSGYFIGAPAPENADSILPESGRFTLTPF